MCVILRLLRVIKIKSKLILFSLKTASFLSPKPNVLFIVCLLLFY
jgi:hypothetical protein